MGANTFARVVGAALLSCLLVPSSWPGSPPGVPQPVRAPEGAPNVLLVMTDDVGFAAASTFGGPIPTPNLDRLAA